MWNWIKEKFVNNKDKWITWAGWTVAIVALPVCFVAVKGSHVNVRRMVDYSAPMAKKDFGGLFAEKASMPMSAVSEKTAMRTMTSEAGFMDSRQVPSFDEDRKMIRNATLEVEVENYAAAVQKVNAVAASVGATIFSSYSDNPEGKGASGRVTFLVDPGQLSNLLDGIGKLGKVKSNRVDSRDVTDQFVDLNARLSSAKNVHGRLVQILNNRTGKLSEILEVEREIARVDQTIEMLEGQIRRLNSQTDRSRLEVYLHEPFGKPSSSMPPIVRELQLALLSAWGVFFSMCTGLLVMVGFLAGLAVYISCVYLAIVLIKKVAVGKKV